MTGKWRKSSHSSGNGGSCVELRLHNGSPQIRDSKMGDVSPILDLSRSDFTALLNSVRLVHRTSGNGLHRKMEVVSCREDGLAGYVGVQRDRVRDQHGWPNVNAVRLRLRCWQVAHPHPDRRLCMPVP